MNKTELLTAIDATIATNGKKGISAQSLKNILNEMVNATPEGGSGSGGSTELVEVRVDFGEGLTEEDKAINAAALAKAASGEDCIFCIDDGYGALIICTTHYLDVINNEDGTTTTTLQIVVESALMESVLGPQLIIISEDGEAMRQNIKAAISMPINMGDVSNISSLFTALQSYVLEGFIYGYNIPVLGIPLSKNSIGVSGTIYEISGTPTEAVGVYKDDITGTICILVATESYFKIHPYKYGVITKDTSDGNMLLFGGLKPELASFIFKYYDTETYSIISADTSLEGSYKFVIYRNGAFETWKVNSDGTTELVTV